MVGGRQNRGAVVTISVRDTDGISAIVSASIASSDGQGNRDFTSEMTRSNANEFAQAAMTFNNARWRNATVTITYTDTASGEDRTLIQAYSV